MVWALCQLRTSCFGFAKDKTWGPPMITNTEQQTAYGSVRLKTTNYTHELLIPRYPNMPDQQTCSSLQRAPWLGARKWLELRAIQFNSRPFLSGAENCHFRKVVFTSDARLWLVRKSYFTAILVLSYSLPWHETPVINRVEACFFSCFAYYFV